MITANEIRSTAAAHGLDLVAVIGVDRLQHRLSGERDRLRVWQENGYAAEMRYMERPPELFTTLEHFLPGVRSVAMFSLSYLNEPLSVGPCPPSHGRVARYAWGLDYHTVIRTKLDSFVQELRKIAAFDYRIFSDSVPLLERVMATTGGLGFAGKNTLVIRPGRGSFTFLAEVLLGIEIEESLETHRGGGCGSCFRCGDKCPTGAIVEPHGLNASRCISYLTIEKRTSHTEWEEEALGDWVFGCDICQEVCPFNNERVEIRTLPEFQPVAGAGPFLDLQEILRIRERGQFRARFGGTALMRAKREQLIRNACGVIGNRGAIELTSDLLEVFESDPAELARTSARRALERLEPKLDGIDGLRVKNRVFKTAV